MNPIDDGNDQPQVRHADPEQVGRALGLRAHRRCALGAPLGDETRGVFQDRGIGAERLERALGVLRRAARAGLARRRCRADRPASPCRARRPCRRPCRAWRRRPRHRAGRRRSGTPGRSPGRSGSRASRLACGALPRIAPAVQQNFRIAPVFIACSVSTSFSPCGVSFLPKRPSAARSSIWPPTMPPRPAARARPVTSAIRTSASGWVSGRASTSKANVSSPSPARIAVASSNFLCAVGRPRRRSSSSIAGRSSCTSE